MNEKNRMVERPVEIPGVVTTKATLRGLLQSPQAREHLEPLLHHGATLERVIEEVYFAGNARDLIQCTPGSIVRAVARAIQMDLLIGVDCFLIPYNKVCTFVAHYLGIKKLMIASGAVRQCDAENVWDCDEFDYQLGTGKFLKHRPGPYPERKTITHVYATLLLPGGLEDFKVMQVAEVEEIRREFAKKKETRQARIEEIPWYPKKTVIRQIAKGIPDRRLHQTRSLIQFDEHEEEFGGIEEAEVVGVSDA